MDVETKEKFKLTNLQGGGHWKAQSLCELSQMHLELCFVGQTGDQGRNGLS